MLQKLFGRGTPADSEAQAVATLCKAKLNLANVKMDDRYRNLPLCVIDAVYSINANYTSTSNTVKRFCRHFRLQETSRVYPPKISDQLSITDLVNMYKRNGTEFMTETVFQNRQRTSTRNGILKSEAIWHVCHVLLRYSVNYFQDMPAVIGKAEFEEAFQSIPGQRSGVSLRYFYMLAGSDDHVKPDRMLMRFVGTVVTRSLSPEACHDLVVSACYILEKDYRGLKPRILDNMIWQYQRQQ